MPAAEQHSRRAFFGDLATGLGSIAVTHLLQGDGLLAADSSDGGSIRPQVDPGNPFAARDSHFDAAAKNVIVIFCSGACSHIDTFDYKPELIRRHGQAMPGADDLLTFQGQQGNLTKSPWAFKPRGECGKMVSDLVPQLGDLTDDICFLHGMTSKTNTHGPGENFMSTGFTLDGFPSIGAWVSYALGSDNNNLPAYVAIPDPRGTPQSSVNNWGPGFLPAAFQGTDFNATNPIRNLARPEGISQQTDKATRDFLRRLNERHQERYPGDTELAARISSYQLAARMQLSVPGVSDLASESEHVLKMYGADDAENSLKSSFAKNCILARRLVEKGVRFVQLFNGAYQTGWRRCQQLGRTQSSGTTVQQTRSGSGPARCRTAQGSEAARNAQGHAGCVVHGIRPHADISKRRQRTGPQSGRIHLLAGRRRSQNALPVWSHRRVRIQGR